MQFSELVQLQVLKRKASGVGGPLLEDFMNRTDNPEIKQLSAKVHIQLIERLDSVCEILDLTKREFIESALVDAVSQAEDAIERSGFFEKYGTQKEL